MNKLSRPWAPQWVLIALFAILSFALVIGGYAYYGRESRAIQTRRYSELKTIAALKIGQIVAWRKERLADAHLEAARCATSEPFARWLEQPADVSLKAPLERELTLLRDAYGYQNAMLLGVDGRILLSLDPRMIDSAAQVSALSERALRAGQSVLGDPFRCPDCGQVHLDVAAPILDPGGGPLALLILRTDPELVLFPLLQAWPTPSATAETLLVRREGDQALFLNRLRHRKDPALTYSNPLARLDLPVTQAVLGKTGEFLGRDYRGVLVLADLQSVPGTAWFMVAKVDAREILVEARYRGGVVLGFMALGILMIGALLGFLYYYGQAKLYQEMVRADEVRGISGFWRHAPKFVTAAALFSLAVGCLVLAGWSLDVPGLKSVLPGFVTMKANTASGFLLSGLGFLLLNGNRNALRLARVVATLVALLGLSTLGEYLLGRELGIDQLLFKEPAGTVGTLAPGRMAPITAVNFLLVGATLLLGSFRRTVAGALWLSLLVALGGLLPLLGYLYGAPGLYGVGHYTQMALHTAATFVILGLGGLLLSPEVGPFRLLASASAAGILLRRVVPFLVAIPILLGYAWALGQRLSYFEGALGAALAMIVLTMLLLGLLWWTALALNRIDGIRRQAETRLRESAQEIRATLYGLGDGVLAVDPGGRLIHMNPVAEHLTGWTEAEAIGRPLEEVFRIISEETEQRVENPVPRVLRDGQIVGLANHTLLIARDGTRRAIADSGAPVFDDQGDILRVVLVFRDQTAERAAQRALTEAERMARGTLDGLSEHIAILDEAGTIQAVNEAWRRFALDNPPLNAPVCEGANYFHACAVALGEDAASAAAFAEGIHSVMEGRQVDYLQEYACHSPEEQRWFLGQVTRFAGAGLVRVVVSHKNITDRKIAENHLRAKTELLSLTGAMAKVGGWEFDTTSLVATWTDEVSRIYDLDAIHEIAIESAIEFYAEASRPVLQKAVRAASEAGEPYDLELVLISARGVRKMVRTMGKPVRDQNGKIVRVQGIIQDITERKLVESQIKAAQVEAQRLLGIADQSRKALLSLVEDQRIAQEEIRRLNTDLEHRVSVRTLELEAANKELEAFAYSVSHDLRAPLRHMDGFLSMLAHHMGADLNAKGAHYLDVAQRASVRMAQLVDGLLSFSRLGRTELRVVAIDTVNLLNSVIEEFKGDCAERVIRWDLGPLPLLHGDPTLIRLVFQNLVGNALKFTRGRPETVIEIQPIEGLAGETGVMIRDNGVGFDPAYTHKLFGVFQRLHREEEFEGTGIGLANVHRIVSRHRGRVWAEGRLGQGAAFYITLPITEEGS